MGLMKRWLGHTVLKCQGWRLATAPSPPEKCVIIVAPHTSNQDFFIGLAVAFALDVKVHWLAKRSIFIFPLGLMLRAMGGIPVNRRSSQNLVQQVVGEFARRPRFRLALSPEGTRQWTATWKSGFYHMALAAGVPVVLGYLDYGRKVGGLGPSLHLTGQTDADMQQMAAFYAQLKAKRPEDFGPVRLG